MRVVLSVVFVALFGGACVDSPDFSTTQQNIVEENRISTNRISTNRISTNRISTNRISTNRISTNRFKLNRPAAWDLLGTAEQRELLQYIIGCAIAPDVTLEVDYQGGHYVFSGEVGLAPRWLERPMTASEKRWVSACLISRVNNYGLSVPISLRGPHNALTVTSSEANTFRLEEGAFYGNIFTPLHEPIIWVACRGRDQAAAPGFAVAIDDRDCAEPDPAQPGLTKCGFIYAGDCQDWALPRNPYACKKFKRAEEDHGNCGGDGGGDDDDDDDEIKGGYYEKCHDAPGNGHWQHAKRYDEVITVFLTP
jgi:hypothetical protein